MTRRSAPLLALGTAVLALIAAARLLVPADEYGDLSDAAGRRFIGFALAAGVVYAAALLRLRRGPQVSRPALAAALGIGLAARLVLLVTPPVMSTDLYRYVWDGRVQAAGINPYLYKPADPELAFLRDGRTGPEAVFININRPETARTIYPPAAQLLFAAIGRTVSSIWTVKAVMLALELAAGLSAFLLLRQAGRPAVFLLIWAWNPLVILEYAGAGHIDAAALAATGFALLFAAARRPALAGVALGLAIATKLLPAALAPAIWRPRGWRAPVAALALVAAGYALYASAGPHLLGYLGGYAEEERLDQGGGFILTRLVALAVPFPSWGGKLYLVLALAALAALALSILWRPGPPTPERIARDATRLAVALLVTLSPHYPWYLPLALLPSVVVPGWGPIWLTVAGPLLYMDVGLVAPWWPAVVFLPALLWLIADVVRGPVHA